MSTRYILRRAKRKGILLLIFITLLVLMAVPLPGGHASSVSIENETCLAVAVHVSEYTKNHGLSLHQVGGEYPWHYFQIYTLLEEALISDGTPFVEVSDADIEAGELLTASGLPKYPILISLATECISDAEAQAIRSYVSCGGFAYVGSSAWTRKEDGSFRPSFALSTEMGIESTSVGVNNWMDIGDKGKRIRRIADHRLVEHLMPNADILWPMPNAYFDSMRLFAHGDLAGHRAWVTAHTRAKPLVVLEGTDTSFMAVNSFGSGWFIYHAELSPLAGWGEGNAVLLEYAFFRKAIEWAFEAQGLPLVRVSAWPYPYQAAFILRHDDNTDPPDWLVLEQDKRNVHGQYFIVTDWCDPDEMLAALPYDEGHGAIIGGHSRQHEPPDEYSYDEAFSNINEGLISLKKWSGIRPKTWVSPCFGAILDSSFQAIEDCGIIASGGEQSVGPFPHYTLSMKEEKEHYSFVQIPATFWLSSNNGTVLSANDGSWGQVDIRNAVDFVYVLGGLIDIYDHQGAFWQNGAGNSVLYYIDYAQTKPWLWTTTFEEIATWWAARSAVQTSCQLVKNGHDYTLIITANGASSPVTALDIIIPQAAPVTVTIEGSTSSSYRQSGCALKINSGCAQSVEVTWSDHRAPPVAANDAYSVVKDNILSVADPGLLSNEIDIDGDTLRTVLVDGVSNGSLTLNSDGSFTYTPSAGYTGIDLFTYKANDGDGNSNLATVFITVASPNTPPVAVNDAYTFNKDTVLTVDAPGVLENDTDADNDIVTASLVRGVGNGNLTLNRDGSFTYTPSAGYTGTDSFTYKANDGDGDSNLATVSIIIEPAVTFGHNNGNNGFEVPNMLDAMRFRNDIGTGTLTKLEILFNDATPAGKVRLGVYADNNGVPGSLLLDAGEVAVTDGWVSINGLSLMVMQDTYYWLAFNLQNSNGIKYQSGQPGSSHYWVRQTYGALPEKFNPAIADSNNNQWVMRATVTTSGP